MYVEYHHISSLEEFETVRQTQVSIVQVKHFTVNTTNKNKTKQKPLSGGGFQIAQHYIKFLKLAIRDKAYVAYIGITSIFLQN